MMEAGDFGGLWEDLKRTLCDELTTEEFRQVGGHVLSCKLIFMAGEKLNIIFCIFLVPQH